MGSQGHGGGRDGARILISGADRVLGMRRLISEHFLFSEGGGAPESMPGGPSHLAPPPRPAPPPRGPAPPPRGPPHTASSVSGWRCCRTDISSELLADMLGVVVYLVSRSHFKLDTSAKECPVTGRGAPSAYVTGKYKIIIIIITNKTGGTCFKVTTWSPALVPKGRF